MASLVRPTLIFLALATVTAGLAVAACSSDVTPAPDAPDPRYCDPTKPVIPCEAGAPGALGACTGDPKATNDVRLMPTNASYPAGCRAYFPAQDCSSKGSCYCREDDGDAGTARWVCER